MVSSISDPSMHATEHSFLNIWPKPKPSVGRARGSYYRTQVSKSCFVRLSFFYLFQIHKRYISYRKGRKA